MFIVTEYAALTKGSIIRNTLFICLFGMPTACDFNNWTHLYRWLFFINNIIKPKQLALPQMITKLKKDTKFCITKQERNPTNIHKRNN